MDNQAYTETKQLQKQINEFIDKALVNDNINKITDFNLLHNMADHLDSLALLIETEE